MNSLMSSEERFKDSRASTQLTGVRKDISVVQTGCRSPKWRRRWSQTEKKFAASKHLNGKQEFIYHAKKQYHRYIPWKRSMRSIRSSHSRSKKSDQHGNRTVVRKRPSAGWKTKIRQGAQLSMSRGIRKKQTRAEIQRAKRHQWRR